jgi:monomeric isocitrate dehydrogenase
MNKEELEARRRELQDLIKPLATKKDATEKETKSLAAYLIELKGVEVQIEGIVQVEKDEAEKVIADKKAFDAEVQKQVEKVLAKKEPPG